MCSLLQGCQPPTSSNIRELKQQPRLLRQMLAIVFGVEFLRTVSKFRKRTESCCLVFPASTKREFRHFHVQSCYFLLIKPIAFGRLSLPSASSLLKLPIENWWGRDDRWRHNAHVTWRHLWKIRAKKMLWNCNIWPNWLISHQWHYCLYYKVIPEFVRKRSILTVK